MAELGSFRSFFSVALLSRAECAFCVERTVVLLLNVPRRCIAVLAWRVVVRDWARNRARRKLQSRGTARNLNEKTFQSCRIVITPFARLERQSRKSSYDNPAG